MFELRNSLFSSGGKSDIKREGEKGSRLGQYVFSCSCEDYPSQKQKQLLMITEEKKEFWLGLDPGVFLELA